MSSAPERHAPFVCVSCAREIAARAWHVILTPHSARCRPEVSPTERKADAGVMVCAKCRDLPSAHQRLFPLCTAPGYCDLYDHGHTLAVDRAAAVAWLTEHNRFIAAPSAGADTSSKENERG